MMRALYTAGTGMVAQQRNLDVISNNLANVNTTGFKGQRAEFQDLMYTTLKAASGPSGNTGGVPQGTQVGFGVVVSETTNNFTQGSLENTGNPLNMAIENQGFFKVMQANGTPAYTRDGTFSSDANGLVVNTDGLPLQPPITIQPNSTAVTVQSDGTVMAILPGASSATEMGKVQLTNFTNPGGLSRIGGNLFVETDASGAAQSGAPGENGTGKLVSNTLEGSNVEVVSEMARMITAQRSYEINSKAIQTADDMLSIVNNLKR